MRTLLRRFSIAALVLFARPVPSAFAQGCTAAQAWDNYVSISATMGGTGGQYVGITARTQEPPGDPCSSYLQSEAWINPGGTPVSGVGVGTADATATQSGNLWGVWTGTTKHWYVYRNTSGSDTFQFKGSLDRSIDLGSPPPPPSGCIPTDYGCDPSPILISLTGGGYHLTSAHDGVWFDITGTGVLQRVAWTPAGSMIGLLAYDRNGNGLIDDGTELFGNFTILSDGSRAANGFAALLDLDDGLARIDHSHRTYSKLLLWFDLNHNGISEPDELISLADAGVTAIYTGYVETPRVDRFGNQFRLQGSALLMNQRGHEVPRRIFDVFLATVP